MTVSPYRNGEGDIVREPSDACREAGLAFGIYLSLWTQHSSVCGSGKEYDDYFVNQLEELLMGYGEILRCAVWFDGACGEGRIESGRRHGSGKQGNFRKREEFDLVSARAFGC